MKKESQTFSPKELSIALNNCTQACSNPTGCDIMGNSLRRQKLREYALALLEPLLEHVKEGTFEEDGVVYPSALKPQELVFVLCMAALYVHLKEVVRTDRVPMGQICEWLFKQE